VRIFKEGFKKQTTGTIQDRLSLYRMTPHTTTDVSPSELLLGRKMKSRLDLLKHQLEQRVLHKQNSQKEGHDKRARSRSFEIGNTVFVKNHGSEDKLLPGEIIECRGPLSYRVKLQDSQYFKLSELAVVQ